MARRCVLVLVAALAACAQRTSPPAHPHGPDPRVRAEVDAAEAAEGRREHHIARQHYEAAVAAADASPSATSRGFAHREFGETLATWGEVAEARTHLEASVAAIPDDPIAWQMLGIVRSKLGDTAGAFVALERSKQLAPRAWIPRRDLAVLHWSLADGRTASPDPQVAAQHRAAALAEYRGMLDLELPDRLRDKVKWAIDVLSQPR